MCLYILISCHPRLLFWYLLFRYRWAHHLCFLSMSDLSRSSFFDKYIYIYIYIYIFEATRFAQMAKFDWFRNLKIPGFHFYGTMKLFTKVVWLYFVKVLNFPNHKTSPCALRAPTFLVTWQCMHFFELLRPKFCFARSHTASKQKNRWFAGSWLSFSNFQVSPRELSNFFVRRGFWTSWSCCNWRLFSTWTLG